MTDAADERVKRLLKEKNLDGYAFDSLSFKALCQHLTDNNDKENAAILPSIPSTSHYIPPVMDIVGNEEDLPFEERLLKQLEHQTKLILDLHQRVDELTTTVQAMAAAEERAPRRLRRAESPEIVRPVDFTNRREPRIDNDPPIPPGDQVRQPMDNRVAFPFFTRLMEALLAFPRHVEETRLARIIRLFFELRRRQVPDLDGGLFIKALIVIAILMARLSNSRHANSSNILWIYRFYFIAGLILAGYLARLGYTEFLHNFFVKENYPARIWNGEDINADEIDHEPVARPVPRPPLPGNRRVPPAERPQPHWGQVLLGGQIPRQPVLPGPLNAVFEILVLLGSFLLSIFPMWRPEAAPLPAAPADDEQEAEREPLVAQHDDDDEDDQLPRVRPPVDPAEYEDDED